MDVMLLLNKKARFFSLNRNSLIIPITILI